MDTSNLKNKRLRYRDMSDFGKARVHEKLWNVFGYVMVTLFTLAVIVITSGGAATWFTK